MKRYDVDQGTVEWLTLRAGKPTASCFHKILTPKKLEVSTQSRQYLNRLLAELIIGRPIDEEDDEFKSEWMMRGSDLERKAVEAYEFQTEQDTELVGFLTTDDGTVGASPDRLAGENGACEMKAPKLQNHVGYMLNPQSLVEKYKLQLQGQLYVGAGVIEWDDIVSFHPLMPLVRVRVYPDEEIQRLLAAALGTFVEHLHAAWRTLDEQYGPFERATAAHAPVDTKFLINDSDLEALVAHHQVHTWGEHAES